MDCEMPLMFHSKLYGDVVAVLVGRRNSVEAAVVLVVPAEPVMSAQPEAEAVECCNLIALIRLLALVADTFAPMKLILYECQPSVSMASEEAVALVAALLGIRATTPFSF
jgi:hypothetical protein